MVKYLGSKRTLLPLIRDAVAAFPHVRTVLDLFSGTSRVGHALKRTGYRVLAVDHNAYAATLARCYVQADREAVEADARRILADLSRLHGSPGYFTHTFCERSRFIHPRNGERIDAIRDAIARLAAPPELEAVLLVSLMEAADRVDSTTGVQMAYLKQWAPRALNALELRLPDVLPRAEAGKGLAFERDALEAASTLEADLAYIDPPYNQHSYLGNYHIWETLVRWDAPEVYGVACKRADCRERRSIFNSRPNHAAAMQRLIDAVRAPILIVSFSDEGYLGRHELESMLARRGTVLTLARDYPRYVGAKIGIHNPKGERVGTVSHLRNTEHLFVCAEPDHACGLREISATMLQDCAA
jgi:adenine-specific DNA-methyltransferase